MRKGISLTLILVLTTLTFARPVLQEPSQNQSKADAVELTNKDVVDMHTSGLADEVIIAKIRTSPSRFDTAPAALTTLKAAGLSDRVLTAMVHGRLDPALASSAAM